MQENIEAFVRQFGIDHCFEFTITAKRLDPEEFSKRLNSCLTNCLRKIFPDRVMVMEPHKSGFAHCHALVAVKFSSPNFDHEALRKSRELFKQKRFNESKREWAKVRESMSPEHSALFDELRAKLPIYGLGNMVSLSPVRESARAIACYFGKYLAKGIAERPEDWRRVRLVRYSGQGAEELPEWKKSTPLRSGNGKWAQNHRDKLTVLSKEVGLAPGQGFESVLGPRWHFHARGLVDRIQLPVYRSFLHAELDGVPVTWPGPGLPKTFPHPDLPGEVCIEWPEWAERDPFTPVELKPDALTAREVAGVLLEVASHAFPEAQCYYSSFKKKRYRQEFLLHADKSS